ncbi:O-antigen ligase [Phenylobacterium sp. Root700]|uniref:O-antigen ligase family protein n=1 Tax=Phenylobacterium sp. Root700 TaxID=1736591 RepID=UPI0006F9EE14|nr:O-antigen ligase family protein [Phenylobacterium sp. Root700]KRB45289.1 hypothetical protein ASE02_20175 [Phenylobacterium sp. Root700]
MIVPTLAILLIVYGFFFAITAPYYVVQFAFPIAFLGAVSIWALPDSKKNPSHLTDGFLFAFLICLVLWPRYLALALPGLPWITTIRLTGVPLVFILLISASISSEFRVKMVAILNSTPAIWKILCVFLVVQILTIPFAKAPFTTINRVINAQISWTAIFFAACYVFSKPGRAERWFALMWVLALSVGVLAVIERPIGHVPWAGHIPSFLKVEDDSVARILVGGVRMYGGGYRVQGPFTTSLGLAEFMALSLPFVMHFAVGQYRLAIRLAAAISVPFLIYIILLTDSRLGLLGAFAAFLAYVLIRALLEWRRRRDSLIPPAVLFGFPALLTAVIASTFLVGRIRSRIWGGQYQSSNEGRMEQISAGIPKILHQPIGHGMNNAGPVLGWVQPNGLLTIDVYYLAVALDYGIVGFFAFFGFFSLGISKGFKQALLTDEKGTDFSLLVPLTVGLITWILIKAVFADEGNHAIAFMMMGMIVALVYRTNLIIQTRDGPTTAPDAASKTTAR